MEEIGRFLSRRPNAEQILFHFTRYLDDTRVPHSATHSDRVAVYAELCGRNIGLSEQELNLLRKGSLLHDIGKIAVPKHLLHKNESLTMEEYEIVKLHPILGNLLCASIDALKPILPAIKYHHERYNGSGYPEGLIGDDIPLLARIIGLADCYDALTTNRAYHKALPAREAIKLMHRETLRGLWDPDLFYRFVEALENKPFMRSSYLTASRIAKN